MSQPKPSACDLPFEPPLGLLGQLLLLFGPTAPLWSATLLVEWTYHGEGPLRLLLGEVQLIPSWADNALRVAFIPAVLVAFSGPFVVALSGRLSVSPIRRALLVLASLGLALVALAALFAASIVV